MKTMHYQNLPYTSDEVEQLRQELYELCAEPYEYDDDSWMDDFHCVERRAARLADQLTTAEDARVARQIAWSARLSADRIKHDLRP